LIYKGFLVPNMEFLCFRSKHGLSI